MRPRPVLWPIQVHVKVKRMVILTNLLYIWNNKRQIDDDYLMTSCVPAPSTSVGAQRRRQTDTSIFSVRARHTDAARPSLAAVSGTHRFQASCAHLSMSSWSGATVSFRLGLHPARRAIPTAAVSGRRHPHSLWSDVHGCPLLAIVRLRWLEAASRTVCRPTSPQLQRRLFFGTASKLISFPDLY